MKIIPAIDLNNGKVVRLREGKMSTSKIYSDDPLAIAKDFERLGAKYLHIIDLNGAFKGELVNLKTIKKIIKNTSLNIQVGGGIRNEESIKKYTDIGVKNLILGSIAIKNPDFVKEMSKKYNIMLGVDVIDEYIAIQGWSQISKIKAKNFIESFKENKIKSFICTDIKRDGKLEGINIEFIKKMASLDVPIIASGGVKDENDLIELNKIKNIEGVIIGKAFYEKTINLTKLFKFI